MIRTIKRILKRLFRFRDARTGQFVSPDYAKRNESTTIREKVK